MGWLPFVGAWIERGRVVNKALARLTQRTKEGVAGKRERLIKKLQELDAPIVVILDDVDRLSTAEIRDLFKLVRLTASFPNIIYIVAFDRKRVEQALTDEGAPGRDYLEKILQLGIDLPPVPDVVLTRQVLAALDEAIGTIEDPGDLDEQVWPDVFVEVIRPLIGNMRDVRRYALAVHGTVGALKGDIALADVMALEAVRVFLPDVFSALHGAVTALTTTTAIGTSSAPPEHQSIVTGIVALGDEDTAVVTALINRLFPAASRYVGGANFASGWERKWLRERRVAHEHVLRLYLERVAGEGLQNFFAAERAWEVSEDQAALDAYLRDFDIDRLEDVIAQLEAYEDEFGPQHVVPATTVLLNVLPELPERPRGMFDFGPRMVVGRVTYRLLRVLTDPNEALAAATAILPQLTSLSSQLMLIDDAGHREGVGHKFLTEDDASRLEAEWRAKVRSTAASRLALEHDLIHVLHRARSDAVEGEDVLVVPALPEVTAAVFRGARSDVRSQSLDSRAVTTRPRLVWDGLVELYGDEETIRVRLDELRASGVEADTDLLDLIERYLDGWRPREFE